MKLGTYCNDVVGSLLRDMEVIKNKDAGYFGRLSTTTQTLNLEMASLTHIWKSQGGVSILRNYKEPPKMELLKVEIAILVTQNGNSKKGKGRKTPY